MMHSASLSRRRFLSAAAAGFAALSTRCTATLPPPVPFLAADLVDLGQTGARISRLGMGTGTNSGAVQRELGADGFKRLVQYAYDRGVRYIDTASGYRTHDLVRNAIQGLPRDDLFILTKMPWENPEVAANPLPMIDRYRSELDTDYLDCLLIHCTTKSEWPTQLRSMMEGFEEAQHRGWIRHKGVSCHGLPALLSATSSDWVDVHLVRFNPKGHHCDGDSGDWESPGRLDVVVREVTAMHGRGRGIIGMKIIGNGDFTDLDTRRESVRYAVHSGLIHSMTIGFKSEAEIDEALNHLNSALRG
jgi:1-deoxyxylulose-5-phosphate synthase